MKKVLFMLLAMFLMASCTSMLPKQFTALADKVEKNGASFSKEQWDKASEKFDDLVEQYNQNIDKFNAEQKKEINSAIGRFQAAVLKAGLGEVGKSIDEFVEGAKGFLEGLGGDKEE